MFNLWVYQNKERIGVVESITSLQWLERYTDVGEFMLVCAANSTNLSLIKQDNILYKPDGDTAGIIDYVETNASPDGLLITARGKLSATLLDHRVVLATQNITNIELGMRNLVTKNLRGLDAKLGTFKNYSDKTATQITWNSILDGIKTLSQSSNIGFKCIFDPDTADHLFTVYKGIDRTQGSSGYNGYFGDDMGNLKSFKSILDKSDYKNIAVVAGRGTGASRKVIFVGSNADRRELYVDADDIDTTYSVATDTGKTDTNGNPIVDYVDKTYTDAEYINLLTARGLEKLAEHNSIDTVSAEIDVTNQMQYRVDFNLGDIVPVKSGQLNKMLNARVTEIKEVYEQSGYQVLATLGEPLMR